MKNQFTTRVLFISIFFLLNSNLLFTQDLEEEREKIFNTYKRIFESAHPSVDPNAKINFMIPVSDFSLPDFFTNVNLIDSTMEVRAEENMQNESSIAVNPLNTNILIGSAVDYRDSSSTWVYLSTNAGKSWKNINLKRPFPGWRSTNDPSVAFDQNGVGYLVYGGFGDLGSVNNLMVGENGVFLAKTTDNGTTWNAHIPIILHKGPQTLDSTFEDKYYITIDNSKKSPYSNHLYVPWKRVTPKDSATQIVISKSTDKGNTWSVPVNVSNRVTGSSEDTTFGQSFPISAMGPNGEVYVVWNHGIEHGVGFARSLDGGATFTQPRIVHNYNIFGITRMLTGQGYRHTLKGKVRAEAYPSLVCDWTDSPRSGNLYLCWAADRVPNIYFSYSTNKGDSWSKPVIVHSDTTNDQFWPWMALDEKTGDIAIMYLDSRNDSTNKTVECYVSYSSDGGINWQDRKVSDIGSDLTLNPFTGNAFAGDYNGLAFHNGMIYPSWVDMRNAKKSIYDSDVFTGILSIMSPLPPDNFIGKSTQENLADVKLTWTKPQKRVFGHPLKDTDFSYTIYRDNKYITNLSSEKTEYIDKSLNIHDLYEYKIVTIAGKDTSVAVNTSVYPGGARKPAAPRLVAIKGSDINTVKINCLIPTVREDGINPLMNLAKVVLYRDSLRVKEIIVTSADTGKTIEIIDTNSDKGYYRYSLSIMDSEISPNESSRTNEFLVYTGNYGTFSDDFTSDKLRHYLYNETWGLSDNSAPIKHVLTETPTGKYGRKKSYTFQMFPVVPVNNMLTFKFRHLALVHKSDSCFVEYSKDNGTTWVQSAMYNKTSYPDWESGTNILKEEELRIPANNDTIITRFRLSTNNIYEDDGWYIAYIETKDIKVGVKDNTIALNPMSVYPNPANDYVNISLSRDQIVKSVVLYSITGNKIETYDYSYQSENQQLKLNLKGLSIGSYLVELTLENNTKLYARFFMGY